ncbi:MAG: adenylyltransferase/cytidyltransferase family protein [Candidatus Liptonbacteria bacterium]|nr:adenylyltransferase/cytidyltransferase family protein [Candidatus Liptonbacteria bacterium]
MNQRKQKSTRPQTKKIIVAVSGGFDPLHAGHVRLFAAARALGDELVVILNNDHWLRAKKGFVFMTQAERAELTRALRPVDRVIVTRHAQQPKDMSVCAELRQLKPDIFANGGDRDRRDAAQKTSPLNADQKLCRELGIRMVFNVGRGGKIQSSSWLLNRVIANNANLGK